MATATCQTVLGLLSISEPFKLRSSTGVTVVGVISVAGRSPWIGSTAKPKDVNWIPLPTVKVLNDNGTMTRPWYLFFKEIADRRLGGINAETVPQVTVKQDQVNAYLVDVQSGVTTMGVQVSTITDAVNTQTEVAVSNSLTGATQIPIIPRYNPKVLDIE